MARNDGAIQLARTGKTHAEIAKAIGVSRVAVSHWLAGTRRPLAPGRHRLLEVFDVAIDAWDRITPRVLPFTQSTNGAAHGTVSSPGTTAGTTGTSGTSDVPAVAEAIIPHGVIPKAIELERMAHQLMRKLHDDPIATPLEQAKVMASISTTLTHLAKLTGEYDLGRRLLRLPLWERIRAVLREALNDFPDAAKSVEAGLRRLEEEELDVAAWPGLAGP